MAELDRIRVTGVQAIGHHGVLAHERRDGQVFIADVVLHVDTRQAAASDDLALTVDYGAFAGQVRAVLVGDPADLIETVAERIAAAALGHAAVQAVDVVVHKPEAPVGVPVADVAVEVHRSREHLPSVESPVRSGGRYRATDAAVDLPFDLPGDLPTDLPADLLGDAQDLVAGAAPVLAPLDLEPVSLEPAPAAPPTWPVSWPPLPSSATGGSPRQMAGWSDGSQPPVEAMPLVGAAAEAQLPHGDGDQAPAEDSPRFEDLATFEGPALPDEPALPGRLGSVDDPALPEDRDQGDPISSTDAPPHEWVGRVYSAPLAQLIAEVTVPMLETDPLDAPPDHPVEVVLALGSNLGASQETLRHAVADLDATPGVEVTKIAPLARTAPVGGPEQPDFLNTVVLGRTTLSPRALLRVCHELEATAGRERADPWGPRTLDVDIIVYGHVLAVADDLELPHPRAHVRSFVLEPWAQVDPDAVLPGLGGGPVGALASTAPDRGGIRWLALDWWTPPGTP